LKEIFSKFKKERKKMDELRELGDSEEDRWN
jgi:hypothetical protein